MNFFLYNNVRIMSIRVRLFKILLLFKICAKVSRIVDCIQLEQIKRLHIVLRVISPRYSINSAKFQNYNSKTAKILCLQLWVVLHASFCPRITYLSSRYSEKFLFASYLTRHKDWEKYRCENSRKKYQELP